MLPIVIALSVVGCVVLVAAGCWLWLRRLPDVKRLPLAFIGTRATARKGENARENQI